MPDIFVDDNTGDEFVDDAIEAYASKQPVSMPSDAGTMMNRPMAQMTPERKLIEALGFKYPEIERAKGYRPGEIMAGATRGPEYGMEYSSNPILRTGGEIVRGATAPGRKAEQLFAYLKSKTGLSSPEQYQLDKARMAAEEAAYQSKGSAQIPYLNQSPAELIGGMGSMPNPNIGRLPGKLLTEEGMKRGAEVMGKSALAGSIYGQLQPVENTSQDNFLAQNTQQGVSGMFAAPGAQLTAEKVIAPIGKAIGRLKGKGTPGVDVRKIGDVLSSKAANIDEELSALAKMESSQNKGIAKKAKELATRAKGSNVDKFERARWSAQVRELSEKEDVSSLYRERNTLADELGAKVKNDKVRRAIAQAMDDAKRNQDKATLNYLEELYDRINNSKNEFYVGTKFTDWDKLRSMVGDEISSSYTGKASVTGPKGSGLLQPVKDAITEAMDDSASIYGHGLREITDDARVQKAVYQEKWQDPMSRQVHGKMTPEAGIPEYGEVASDKVPGLFAYQGENHGIQLGKTAEKAESLFSGAGKNNIKSILFDAAKAKANGNPAVFLQELDQPGIRKFFDGADLDALDGLRKILQASESMGQTTATLGMGGAGYVLGSMGGHEGIGALAGLSTGAVGGRFRGIQIPERIAAGGWMKLLSHPAGQRLLLQAKRAEGPALQAILDNVTKFVSSSLATPDKDKLKGILKGQKQ